jgi:hypothetical protein
MNHSASMLDYLPFHGLFSHLSRLIHICLYVTLRSASFAPETAR